MSEPPSASGPGEPGTGLTHVRQGPHGPEGQMVDVSAKPTTARTARARARVEFPAGVLAELRAGNGPKGPVEDVARVAGVLAAKRTGELVPFCHPLGLDAIEIEFADLDERTLEVRCRAACTGRTGVEMEAMVGASVAALTVYDMAKGLDKGIRIRDVELVEKTGGKSGTWRAEG